MSERLKSRKLWVTVGTIVAFLITEFTGYEVDPQAVVAVALLVGTYVASQAFVDKNVIAEEIKVGGDLARIEVIAYAKNLEMRLAELLNEEEEVQE